MGGRPWSSSTSWWATAVLTTSGRSSGSFASPRSLSRASPSACPTTSDRGRSDSSAQSTAAVDHGPRKLLPGRQSLPVAAADGLRPLHLLVAAVQVDRAAAVARAVGGDFERHAALGAAV